MPAKKILALADHEAADGESKARSRHTYTTCHVWECDSAQSGWGAGEGGEDEVRGQLACM